MHHAVRSRLWLTARSLKPQQAGLEQRLRELGRVLGLEFGQLADGRIVRVAREQVLERRTEVGAKLDRLGERARARGGLEMQRAP